MLHKKNIIKISSIKLTRLTKQTILSRVAKGTQLFLPLNNSVNLIVFFF